jgi:hypothetical protein
MNEMQLRLRWPDAVIAAAMLIGVGYLGHRISISHQHGDYYHTERVNDGQVRVICDNGGDATVRPSDFGSIVVDCGTR